MPGMMPMPPGFAGPAANRGFPMHPPPGFHSGGTMESALDRKAMDDLLGPTTMRTKGTVEQLAAKFFG